MAKTAKKRRRKKREPVGDSARNNDGRRVVRKTSKKAVRARPDGDPQHEDMEVREGEGSESPPLRRKRRRSSVSVQDSSVAKVNKAPRRRTKAPRRKKEVLRDGSDSSGDRDSSGDGGSGRPKGLPKRLIPLQENYVPAKNKGWSCNFCKFFQYVSGADLREWKGTRKKINNNSTGAPFKANSHYVQGVGPEDAKVMFVGEAPGREEDENGEPFIGNAGETFNRTLKRAGFRRSEVYVTNIVKCRPPNNATPSYTDCIPCSCFLAREIHKIKPRVIVPMGKPALQAVLGSRSAKITDAHGSPLQMSVAGHQCIVFPVWHPSYVNRNDHLGGEYVKAFKELAKVIDGDLKVTEDEGTYLALKSPEKCVKILKRMAKAGAEDIVAFDFETSGLKPFYEGQRIACLSVSKDDGKGYAIPLYTTRLEDGHVVHDEVLDLGWPKEMHKEVIEAARAFLASDAPKIGHNVKFDMNWAEAILGVRPNNVIADTMIMHYVTDENSLHGLKPLVLKYTNMGAYEDLIDGEAKKTKKRYDLIPYDTLGTYAAMDAVATIRVYDRMCDEIEESTPHTEHLAVDFLPRALRVLQKMEAAGAHIDLEFAQQLHEEKATEIEALKERLEALPVIRKFIRNRTRECEEENKKFKFSVNSPPQMAELFFGADYLNYSPLPHKMTDTGNPSVDKEVMQHFADTRGCEVAKIKQELGLDMKLQSTYIEKLMVEAAKGLPRGFIHGTFKPTGTVTGRLSSAEPNLQNIPLKGAACVKRMFDSRFGADGCILQADFSQIELRILAALSGDENMIKVYLEGRDIHKNTTLRIFEEDLLARGSEKRFKKCKTPEEIYDKLGEKEPHEHKRMRVIAKRINFGIAYGIGADGIVNLLRAESVVIEKEQAAEYIEKFYDAYPGVRNWIDEVHRELEDSQFLTSVYGRMRRLPEVSSRDHEVNARAKRQGPNFLIQSPASDTTLTSLILISEEMEKRGLKSVPIITVHDSIIIDCVRDEIEEVSNLVKDIMENVPTYGERLWYDLVDFAFLEAVPIVADVDVGVNWRDLVEVTDTVSDALMKSELKATGEGEAG